MAEAKAPPAIRARDGAEGIEDGPGGEAGAGRARPPAQSFLVICSE